MAISDNFVPTLFLPLCILRNGNATVVRNGSKQSIAIINKIIHRCNRVTSVLVFIIALVLYLLI